MERAIRNNMVRHHEVGQWARAEGEEGEEVLEVQRMNMATRFHPQMPLAPSLQWAYVEIDLNRR